MKSSELYVGMEVGIRYYRYGDVTKGKIVAVGHVAAKHERPTHTVEVARPDGSGTTFTKSVKPHQIVCQWNSDLEAAAKTLAEQQEEQKVINDLKAKLTTARHEHAQEVANLADLLGLEADTVTQWRTYTNSEGKQVGERMTSVIIHNLRALEAILRPQIAQKLLGGQNSDQDRPNV